MQPFQFHQVFIGKGETNSTLLWNVTKLRQAQ